MRPGRTCPMCSTPNYPYDQSCRLFDWGKQEIAADSAGESKAEHGGEQTFIAAAEAQQAASDAVAAEVKAPARRKRARPGTL